MIYMSGKGPGGAGTAANLDIVCMPNNEWVNGFQAKYTKYNVNEMPNNAANFGNVSILDICFFGKFQHMLNILWPSFKNFVD